jgi:hypothetical protein
MSDSPTTNALARVENQDQAALMAVEDVKFRLDAVQNLMRAAMSKGDDYGVIPGTGSKPTLLKPGAEKLCTLFRLAPTYHVEKITHGKDHREYLVSCTLTHISTGKVWGQGEGCCSTLESKYRWRRAERKCPQCHQPAIIKGKQEYGGGWVCFKNKGGCGAKFPDNAAAITSQPTGRVENPDIADQYNTVLKMATKRALVAAVLITTGASALFTQDLEEDAPADEGDEAPSGGAGRAPAPRQGAPGQRTQQPSKPPQKPAGGSETLQRLQTRGRVESAREVGRGVRNNTQWIRYEIKIADRQGTTFSTFSKTLFEVAEIAIAEDTEVVAVFIDKGEHGFDLQELVPASEDAEVEGEVVGAGEGR